MFPSWLLTSVSSIPNLEVFHMCFPSLSPSLTHSCAAYQFRSVFPVLSCFELCRSNVSQPLRKRFHASDPTLLGSIQNLSQFMQVYWADGAYLTLSYNTLLSVWLFMTCACCVASPRQSVASYFKNYSNKCICCCCLFSYFVVVCVRLLFAFSLCLCVFLSYGNSIALWVSSWTGDGWSCPAGNQDVNRSLDCFSLRARTGRLEEEKGAHPLQ